MIGMPTPQVDPSPCRTRICTGLPDTADGEADVPGDGPVEAVRPACQAAPGEDPLQAVVRMSAIPSAAAVTADRHERESLMTATVLRTRRARIGCPWAADLVGALFAEDAEVDGGPGAVGTPRRRDLVEGGGRSVLLDDLGVESGLVVRQRIGMVGAADHHQLRGERAEALYLLHLRDGGLGVEVAQAAAVEEPVEGGVGDGAQVLDFAAGQVELERAQPVRSGEGAVVAVAADEVAAQTSGLRDAEALGQDRPGGGLVR